MRVLKAAALGLALLIVGVSLALGMTQEADEIATDIWISRPPDVWRVLTETAAFPSWNPFIHRLDGSLAAGQRITVEFGTGDDATIFHPKVLAAVPERELRWHGSVWPGGIFDGEHSFTLSPEAGGTRLVQGERFSGLLVGPLTRGIIAGTEREFTGMNRALKARVESGP